MLTFLRKIRLRLVKQTNSDGVNLSSAVTRPTRKYVLYAIGEILLVMIGILLALQVNNWNEERKNRVKERDLVTALSNNLNINIRTIESNIDQLKLLNISSEVILNVLDNKLPYHDSLDVHFHHSRISKSDLHLSQAGYEQYKQAGFTIICDKQLKDEVVNLFESTYPEFYITFRQVNEWYVPFIDHHVPLFIYLGEELKPIDFKSLYKDQYFIGWLRAYSEGRNTLIGMESDFLDEIKRVLFLIEDALGK